MSEYFMQHGDIERVRDRSAPRTIASEPILRDTC